MYYRRKSNNKYNSTKFTRDGETFDSQAEFKRFRELTIMQEKGEIYDLKRQVEYELLPAYFESIPTGEYYKRGERKGMPKFKDVCIEQAVKYYADFVYTITATGETIVEDVKGYVDPMSAGYAKFVLKRKLMLHIHGIKVKEINTNNRKKKRKVNEENNAR